MIDHSPNTNKKVHMGWTIGVLVAVIIGLLSKDLGTVTGIKDILSFALSFASLILALIAIFQSILSSGSFDRLMSSLGSRPIKGLA
jgi:hypothetical protein